ARSSARLARSRSRPSNSASPDVRAPWVRPTIVSAETVLPDPDSPTMPSVRPRSSVNDTPRTACTTPAAVANETCRSRTSRSGASLTDAPARRAGSRRAAPAPASLQPDVRGVAAEGEEEERAVLHAGGVEQRPLLLVDGDVGDVLHQEGVRLLPELRSLGGR